jgi:pyruvate dehydrogenase E1 component alpha subunit
MEPNKLLDLYTRILRIRRFEEQVGTLFAQGQLQGFVHLYIGEEAVGAGVSRAAARRRLHCEHTTGHGHVLAKGAICSA